MSHDKRYVAQKRQRRRRKTAKAKLKLYEAGKLKHDNFPALAKKFFSRNTRAPKAAAYLGQSGLGPPLSWILAIHKKRGVNSTPLFALYDGMRLGTSSRRRPPARARN